MVGGKIFRCQNCKGQFKVIRGHGGQFRNSQVQSTQGHRGSQGQIRTDCPMEVKLGWWRDIPMPKIVKVNSRSSGSQGSNPYILSYGSETWLVERYSDAENCKGQFLSVFNLQFLYLQFTYKASSNLFKTTCYKGRYRIRECNYLVL